jgi:hypothetical protein
MYRTHGGDVAQLRGRVGNPCNKMGLRDSEDEKITLPMTTPGIHNAYRDCMTEDYLKQCKRKRAKKSKG